MSRFNFWETEITFLKKVGPKRAELLEKEAGIRTFGDLLQYFPRKYIDKSRVHKIREVHPGMPFVTLVGQVMRMEMLQGKSARRLRAVFRDDTGQIELVWFKGINWIKDSLKTGQEIVIFGQPKFFGRNVQIAHPEIEPKKTEGDPVHLMKIVPFYPGTEKLNRAGLDSKGIRGLMNILLDAGKNDMQENLPPGIVARYHLIPRKTALLTIHFPESFEQLEAARRRLKFEEFFFFQLMLAQRKAVQQPKLESHPFPVVGEYFNKYYHEHLPFELTGAQKRVLKEIRADLRRPYQMNRLVQGDVGCGKTMVAFMACLIAIDNGFQAAIMAPTEILAEQHFQNFKKYSDPLGLRVTLLVGGQRKAERREILTMLKEGLTHIAVGTHALIEDKVQFKNLGLSIVDEQHKFGVKQRAKLWMKGEKFPHNMVMTATPIPRTLGMTLYGDLSVSVIDEMPPGRTPIKTAVRSEAQRLEVFGFIRKQLEEGRQAYIVYPLIEESEKLDYLAATEGFEAISRAFQGYRVGIVHGRQKAEDKEMEMRRFKKGELHILVSTTVIEVGVDVPNATIMVIENSEKFGLSQLHQLRGRVGRGGGQSFCILMVGKKTSDDARKRLKAMVSTHDGFKIADYDLKLRGPGDFLGTRQSGMPEFKLANIVEDGPVLVQAREAAFDLIDKDPDFNAPQNQEVRIYFQQYLRDNAEMAGIA